ncbi:hypothetical protein [Urechidicola croceus]|uniref:Uncharacterized protein n=1 Tax=Urechidicola croceus TaxID=1850246 RepID=A0A1D8P4A4_9FLAO|nr:hypothetical protein [Urechidicola croceus]AOW19351.1 hypothetical protein LPB138_01035 [Urechidicola croceus]
MKIKYIIIFFGILISFTFCKQIDSNKEIKKTIYQCKDLGWTINVPENWKITHQNILNNSTKKDFSEYNELIGFHKEKDTLNYFFATAQYYKNEHINELKESHKKFKKLLYDEYTNMEMKVDTSSSIKIIDHLDFNVFHIELSEINGNLIQFQDIYSRYINNYDFSVNITYKKEKEKNELLNIWENSKFK